MTATVQQNFRPYNNNNNNNNKNYDISLTEHYYCHVLIMQRDAWLYFRVFNVKYSTSEFCFILKGSLKTKRYISVSVLSQDEVNCVVC